MSKTVDITIMSSLYKRPYLHIRELLSKEECPPMCAEEARKILKHTLRFLNADAHAFINRMDIRNNAFHEIKRACLSGESDIHILNYDITVCQILAKEFEELGYYNVLIY